MLSNLLIKFQMISIIYRLRTTLILERNSIGLINIIVQINMKIRVQDNNHLKMNLKSGPKTGPQNYHSHYLIN